MANVTPTQLMKLKELNGKLYSGITGKSKEDIINNFDEFLNKFNEFINFYEEFNYFRNSMMKKVYKKEMELELGSNKFKTQDEAVLAWLLTGRTISQLQAIEYFSCFRLSAVIYRLRHEKGYNIVDVGHNKWAEYKLISNEL